MAYATHLRVLIKKNFLTLKRNTCFIVFFLILPIITMGLFVFLKSKVEWGRQEEKHHFDDEMYFTTTNLRSLDFFSNTNLQSQCNLALCTTYGFDTYALIGSYQNQTLFNEVNYLLAGQNMNLVNFTTQDEVFDKVRTDEKQKYCFGIQIDKFDNINDIYEFQVMFQRSRIPDTNQPAYDPQIVNPDFLSWEKYFSSGFLAIYPLLMDVILKSKNIYDAPFLEVAYAPMKTPAYDSMEPRSIDQLSQNFPFFFIATFLIPLYYFVSKLSEEKESKAREGMKMMGLKDSAYFISWLVFYFVVVVVMGLIMTGMVSINIFPYSNKFLFFFLTLLYSLTLYGFGIMIVAFIPKQRSSATAATLFHLVSYFLVYLIKDPSVPAYIKFIVSVFPNIAASLSLYNLFHYELMSNGLSFQSSNSWYSNYTFTGGLLMLLFDFVLYSCIGLYFDQILKSEYGVAQKWNFLCTKKYWRPNRSRLQANALEGLEKTQIRDESNLGDSEVNLLRDSVQSQKLQDLESSIDFGNNFEPVAEKLRRQEDKKQCLKIRGLRKQFGDKIAVNDIDLTVYNGQIFALLGHNGAGKTTTISMITGLLEPTAGTASVFGINIFTGMEDLRKIMGVCPQHDVLFDYLTPLEHLHIFAAFKGTPSNQIDAQVAKMIHDLDLNDCKNQTAKTLSGGQKRKLSVGIAMIGNSKIVILDEPTSGMDTTSRRRLWDMLKQNKAGRIVILTTHYMDEADILGDRICIMAEGTVKCCGSSLFLKNRFGVGYKLTIAKKDRLQSSRPIDKFIADNIKDAKKLPDAGAEMIFQLPNEAATQFKQFFSYLDSKLEDLGIESYGVSITTLEEVFLKIATTSEEEEPELIGLEDIQDEMLSDSNLAIGRVNTLDQRSVRSASSRQTALAQYDNLSIYELTEKSSIFVFWLNLQAMLKKKFLLQFREPRTLIIELVFPIVFIIFGLMLATAKFFFDGSPRLLSPSLFPTPNPLVFNGNTDLGGSSVDFVNNYILNNSNSTNMWKTFEQLDIDQSNRNFQSLLTQMDDNMYQNSASAGGFYGNYYFRDMREPILGEYNKQSVIAFINSTSQDGVAAYGSFIHEAFLKKYLNNTNLQFKITNTPFPLTVFENNINIAASGTFSAILIAIAFMMVSDSLIQNIIKERQRNVKHQMVISGASLPAYWISHYIGDVIFQLIISGVVLLCYFIFGLKVEYAWLMFILFSFANPVFIYFLSFLFNKDSSGSIITRIVYVLVGLLVPLTVQTLKILPITAKVGRNVQWFFYFVPIYCLDFGIMNISNNKVTAQMNNSKPEEILDFALGGASIIFLGANILLYWFLILLIETNFLRHFGTAIKSCFKRQSQNKTRINTIESSSPGGGSPERFRMIGDQDIIEEEIRVQQSNKDDYPIRVNQLKKSYNNTVAVEKVSFGLEHGECFALLGVSGAGKTTTFKCLTGEEVPSQGQLTINGFDVTTNSGFNKARKLIGYCPQFDAIFEGMTVGEHLQFYAKVKGIKQEHRKNIITRQLKEMDLKDYEKVRAEKLSGGNKRKLSVAMAMIGNPPIVFLDEPSTGVDPKARRFMWTIVSKISTQRKKSSVILTTHSMEEAEALCTKMGIMVAGRFRCFGTALHIKNKYGTGYEIEIKIRALSELEINKIKYENNFQNDKITGPEIEIVLRRLNADGLILEISPDGLGSEFYYLAEQESLIDINELISWAFTESRGQSAMEYLEGIFDQLTIIEHYNNSYKVKVSRDNYSIGYLFGLMEDIKHKYEISEYSVSQTTLEQIFNNFAREALAKGTMRRKTTTNAQQNGLPLLFSNQNKSEDGFQFS